LKVRDNKELRDKVEKNGKSYLGPLNMEIRREILKRLERIHKLPLEEKREIYKIWRNYLWNLHNYCGVLTLPFLNSSLNLV